MIPLRDKVRSRTTPIVVYTIIAVNALVFIYQMSLSDMQLIQLFINNGLVPKALIVDGVWQDRGLAGQLLPFLTSMFLHGGWLHILGNMWTLFIFGDNVQDRMGKARFTVFYLLSGVASMVAHLVTNWGSMIPTIGASGAIAGVMGAYLVYYPRAKIITLLPIFFYFTVITVPAYVFLFIWIGLQFFNGTFALLENGGGAGIAWWAHIGGFAFGWLTAKLFEKHRPPQVDVNVQSHRFYAD